MTAATFCDLFGCEGAALGWTPGELFDVAAGLVWRLAGERVHAIGAEHVRLEDGRTIARSKQAHNEIGAAIRAANQVNKKSISRSNS